LLTYCTVGWSILCALVDHYGSIWINMDQYGSIWSMMVMVTWLCNK
jgi:hypothetical protein